MTALEALRRGIAALWRHRRLCLCLYFATTVAALLIAGPAMAVAFQSLAGSAWPREMADSLDPAWFSELIAAHGTGLEAPLLVSAIGVGAVSLVVYLFLLGGALEVLWNGGALFAACGRNFAGMIRLALVSLPFYLAALAVNYGLGALGRAFWGEGSQAAPLIHWAWLRAAVLLCLLGIVGLQFDYARIRLVFDDRPGALRATVTAWRFLLASGSRAAALYLMVCAIAGVVFAACLGISFPFAQRSLLQVGLLLMARQAMVLTKIWSRLLFYSTAAEMSRGSRSRAGAEIAAG
jgi:hypothetical protein